MNRGYQKGGELREDGTLGDCTAACAPVIYRGDNFPPSSGGNVFICEPAGNLVTRRILEEEGGTITATNPYAKAVDFIASTDERFRPVNLYTGPDGASTSSTSTAASSSTASTSRPFLREQILDRGLDKGLGPGRIYRVVTEAKPPGPAPKLSKARPPELVQASRIPTAGGATRPSGSWWSERIPPPVARLRALAAGRGRPDPPRLHAMFALDGMRQLDPPR